MALATLLAHNRDYALDGGKGGQALIVRGDAAIGLAGSVLLATWEVGWPLAAAGAVLARHGRRRRRGATGIY